MIKSWVSFLLPDDEYKKQRMLYFIAEGAILLLIFLGITFGVKQYSSWKPDIEIVLGIAIVLFVFYVFLRYTFSGIEYTDVSTATQYNQKIKSFIKKSIIFAITFPVAYALIIGIQRIKEEWIDILAIAIIAALFLFLINYVSLKRSYKINRELLDEE